MRSIGDTGPVFTLYRIDTNISLTTIFCHNFSWLKQHYFTLNQTNITSQSEVVALKHTRDTKQYPEPQPWWIEKPGSRVWHAEKAARRNGQRCLSSTYLHRKAIKKAVQLCKTALSNHIISIKMTWFSERSTVHTWSLNGNLPVKTVCVKGTKLFLCICCEFGLLNR